MARIARNQQPYTNMAARRCVLFSGFTLSVVSLVLVIVGILYLFVPSVNVSSDGSPSVVLMGLLAGGIAVAFVATVLTVAGANTQKGVARFSMFLSTLSFIIGAALLVIILLFRTILPLDALARLGG